jgi:hypothetical protein
VSHTIGLRLSKPEQRAWTAAAAREGLTRNAWVRRICNDAACRGLREAVPLDALTQDLRRAGWVTRMARHNCVTAGGSVGRVSRGAWFRVDASTTRYPSDVS